MHRQGLGVARTQRSHAVVGCPWPQFVAHIEAKMAWWNARHGPEEQMTWLNTHRGMVYEIFIIYKRCMDSFWNLGGDVRLSP